MVENLLFVLWWLATSTSLIAKELGVSTIFYDASGKIQEKRNHDISVLRNKNELLEWKLFLNKNKTFDSVA